MSDPEQLAQLDAKIKNKAIKKLNQVNQAYYITDQNDNIIDYLNDLDNLRIKLRLQEIAKDNSIDHVMFLPLCKLTVDLKKMEASNGQQTFNLV